MAAVIYAGDAGVFKTCTKCGETKPLLSFHKDKRSLLGRSSRCAACAISHVRAYTSEHHEDVKCRKREAWRANPVRAREYEKARYDRDKEKRKRAAAEYYWANREQVLARLGTEGGRKQSRDRMREKMKNPADRLHANTSRAIRASIRDKNRRKWESLVGYTLDEFLSHIERQFLKGMSWENYGKGDGKWHVDHIIPRSHFEFESADDPAFVACWALSNLRPMWGRDNISKHAKRIYLI